MNNKQRLEELKEETEAALKLAESSSATVVLDQTSVGRVSRIDAMGQQQMALEGKRRCERLLEQISIAFERLENDEYGYCANCDEPIAEKRLELNPTVQTCIACAS